MARKNASQRAKWATYMRGYNRKHPLKMKHSMLRHHYGITLERYLQMYDEQKGKCAICGVYCSSFTRGKRGNSTLAVDHDHAVGTIRKLLCPACNKGLGFFRESATIMKSALAYLARHARKPTAARKPETT